MLDLLNDKREKAFLGDKVKIFSREYEKVINYPEAVFLLIKFQEENCIIENLKNDIENGEDISIIQFTGSFDEYIKNELGNEVGTYLKKYDNEDLSNNIDSDTDIQVVEKEILYEISYSSSTEIMINNIHVIKKIQYGTNNDVVFEYLLENPNRKVTLKEIIQKNPDLSPDISLNKIVDSLGFRGPLRKIFFSGVSKKNAFFRNPIYREDFKKLGLPELRLRARES